MDLFREGRRVRFIYSLMLVDNKEYNRNKGYLLLVWFIYIDLKNYFKWGYEIFLESKFLIVFWFCVLVF